MIELRILIRLHYEPTGNRYHAVLHGRVISTQETKEKAAIAIRNVNGRVAAKWERTQFSGEPPVRADFIGAVLDEEIGRIKKIHHGRQRGNWSWSMYANKKVARRKMSCEGYAGTKQEAARMVEWVYTHCVESED